MKSMNILFNRILPFIAVLALSACGGGGGGGTPTISVAGSCLVVDVDFNNTPTCFDYTGADWSPVGVKAACNASTATFSADPCPTDNRVGSCTVNNGFPGQEYVIRTYPDTTAQQSQDTCTGLAGTYIPN